MKISSRRKRRGIEMKNLFPRPKRLMVNQSQASLFLEDPNTKGSSYPNYKHKNLKNQKNKFIIYRETETESAHSPYCQPVIASVSLSLFPQNRERNSKTPFANLHHAYLAGSASCSSFFLLIFYLFLISFYF